MLYGRAVSEASRAHESKINFKLPYRQKQISSKIDNTCLHVIKVGTHYTDVA